MQFTEGLGFQLLSGFRRQRTGIRSSALVNEFGGVLPLPEFEEVGVLFDSAFLAKRNEAFFHWFKSTVTFFLY
jgi:hypothetical protein